MPEAFFLAGLNANACYNAQVVTVTSEDSLFPKANLQNGKPWEPFRFGTVAADQTIDFDCNIISNSGFEDDADGVSPPTGWTINSGTPDVSTVAFSAGSKSLRLNLADEGAYQDRYVRPGGTFRHTVQLRGDGTNAVNAYVRDMVTHKYWTGAAWSMTKTAWATRTTASFALSSTTLTLEAPVVGHMGPVPLRFLFERPGTIAAAAYVDEVYCWPKITLAAIVYDTVPTGFTISIQSDDNSAFSSATSAGNLPAYRFRKFLIFSGPGTPERYWRFLFTGTAGLEYRPWIGQPVLGERVTMTRNPGRNTKFERLMPYIGPDHMIVPQNETPRQQMEMRWEGNTNTGMREGMDQMLGACRFGGEPLLICPRDDRPDFIYGRGELLSEIETEEEAELVFEYRIKIIEDMFPVRTT